MEEQINSETIKKLNDTELQKLSNIAWFEEDMSLSLILERETMRRRHQVEVEPAEEVG